MGTIIRILALVSSIATSGYLLSESLRRGMIIVATILGILKIIVFLTFTALLVFILYLIFTKDRYPSEETY
ncbi:MAG: hypothetical protein AB7H86_11920 [Blastocatellales bacterium]